MKKISPFSNATEAMNWMSNNCDKCKRHNCNAKRNIQLGFISGEITMHSARFIGGEFSVNGTYYPKNMCNGFTTISTHHYTKNMTKENTLDLFANSK